MAGGFVTVTFFGGPMATGPLIAGGTGATATFPGSFLFSVTGDTFTADWTLTNLDSGPAARAITGVAIDLTMSKALFDNDSTPSTPVSLAGVAGAASLTGPPILGAAEVNPWTDPANLGDMFRGQTFGFGGGGLAPGATATWHDDTDLIPEPAAGLAPIALAGTLIRRRAARATART
jgi:hypothetical protein